MRCEECGRTFDDEAECPHCAKAAEALGPSERRLTDTDGPPGETVSGMELAFNGAMAGVLYGTILGIVIVLVAFFSGVVSDEVSLVVAVPIAAAFGALSGSVVGLATVLTQSVTAGVMIAILVEGIMRLTVLNAAGMWLGRTPLGIAISLVEGVVFGLVVAPYVYHSIDWTMID